MHQKVANSGLTSPIDSWRREEIWANLAPGHSKRHLQQDSTLFFPLAPCLVAFLIGHAQKVTFIFRLGFYNFLFAFPFGFLSFFSFEFFTRISEHFHAYFRLHWADHSDVGIIGKIFSTCTSWACCRWCPFWSKVMLSEVEHLRSRHRSQWVKIIIYRHKSFVCKLHTLYTKLHLEP